jgi:hypothetical protein
VPARAVGRRDATGDQPAQVEQQGVGEEQVNRVHQRQEERRLVEDQRDGQSASGARAVQEDEGQPSRRPAADRLWVGQGEMKHGSRCQAVPGEVDRREPVGSVHIAAADQGGSAGLAQAIERHRGRLSGGGAPQRPPSGERKAQADGEEGHVEREEVRIAEARQHRRSREQLGVLPEAERHRRARRQASDICLQIDSAGHRFAVHRHDFREGELAGAADGPIGPADGDHDAVLGDQEAGK